jgi:hypothetical protein
MRRKLRNDGSLKKAYMKNIFAVLTFSLMCCFAHGKERAYQGSTPAHMAVREFLNISRTDSIDFIRWKLVFNGSSFELSCSYGLCQPSTSGFSNEKKVAFSGTLKRQDHLYELRRQDGAFYIREINFNLIHLLDKNKDLLKGNGGWSYTLNNVSPAATKQFYFTGVQKKRDHMMVFEGRTPCRPLSQMIGRKDSEACNKLKWYVILYSDPATGKPSHYLAGGTAYRKETMRRGNWDIITGGDGRITYRLDPEKEKQAIHLLTADNTILLFTHPDGSPLVGNEDFSYTLSRTVDQEKK